MISVMQTYKPDSKSVNQHKPVAKSGKFWWATEQWNLASQTAANEKLGFRAALSPMEQSSDPFCLPCLIVQPVAC